MGLYDQPWDAMFIDAGAQLYDVRNKTFAGGGVVNASTDQGAAITAACNAIQAAGAGTLYLPDGKWRVFSTGTVYTVLGAFSNGKNITIWGPGATLEVDPGRNFATSYGNCFTFTACDNTRINLGRGTMNDTIDLSGIPKGIVLADFSQGCDGITIDRVDLQGGFIAGAIFRRLYTDPESYRCRNIKIGVMKTKRCWYGYSCQFSGDMLTCDLLSTDACYRSIMIYGMTGHWANIESKDQKGGNVQITAYEGKGCRNVHINYTNTRTTVAEQFPHVTVSWFGPTAASHTDITVKLNIAVTGATNGGRFFVFEKFVASGGAFDTTDRGHKLENFVLSGKTSGNPTEVTGGCIGTNPNCDWGVSGTPDVWTNVQVRDMIIESGRYANFNLGACANFHIHNFKSSHSLRLHSGNASLQTSSKTKISWSGKNDYTNRIAYVAGDVSWPIEQRASDTASFTLPAAWMSEQPIYTNIQIGVLQTVTLPLAVPGLDMTFMRINPVALYLDPANAVDQYHRGASNFGKQLRLNSDGAHVRLRCYVAGVWDIVASSGTIAYEP
jgi:hypothetical protein